MSRRAAPDDVMDIFESSVPSAPVPAAPVLVRTR
jgi:hypothetical protein